MVDFIPETLLEYIRVGLVEQAHSGLFLKLTQPGEIFKIGEGNSYPFYLRSCAKPLQASLLIDFGLDDELTSDEIAICCASHAGEQCHVDTVRKLLQKFEISENNLKCGLHKPLSKIEQNKLLLSGAKENILQNNCSGKHAMMLIVCKKMGWGVNDYNDVKHPLQVAIRAKIYELCEVEHDFPVTKDGCGVPICSMPLINMLKGYLNLFLNDKYFKIKEAFVNNPYLIGGEDRLDSIIMGVNKNLIVKVGAGGLCIVVNLLKKEALIVKIIDCDMKARAICIFEALRQLNWLDKTMLNEPAVKSFNNRDIVTLHGEKVGQINPCFKF